ncbi:TPA: LysR family transcriptional regulator [Enterobacter hormaechei subsp. steigerwaltii]|nr:LysR family transcriptional regulator [Enterobacter hormaechei subsp. steigerwaltii]
MYLHKLIFQFRVLADKKTFTAAAESLFISQPTLTQNMQRLESELDVPLLVRDPRGIVLTVYGESLYQHACLLDRNYRQAMQDIDTIKRSHRQSLVIECGHAWSHGVLFTLMQDYIARYPDIRMVIRNSNTESGQQHLLKGECDLALGAIPATENQITAINYLPIFTTRFTVFSSPAHPLAGQSAVTPQQLAGHEWVILRHVSENSEFEDPLLCSVPPDRVRFEVFSVSTAIALVKQSHCILALPLPLEQEARNRGLVPLALSAAYPSFQSGIMYIDDVMKHEHKKAFIDTLISSQARFIEEG